MDKIGAIVIGAGVVGLAIARELALSGHEVLILEAAPRFGTATSARNSGVIHGGLYYPPGSLKAALCVRGRELLYRFCAQSGVEHRRCGKLIIAAADNEVGALEAVLANGCAAGVGDLALLDRSGVRALEPALDCAAAVLSPSTGIVDAHALMLALLGEAESHGAQLVCAARVERVERTGGTWIVHAAGARIATPLVVNAAGLGAQALATQIGGVPQATIPPLYRAKGCYFAYDGVVPFSRLIYPVPLAASLGTHLTLDLAGCARFGPDIHWIGPDDDEDYTVDPALKPGFVAAARRIWPDLDPDRLHPGYAGIRPKISGPGEPAADFAIEGEERHGQPGLVNLFGIESPGLTAALAIAEHVARIMSD